MGLGSSSEYTQRRAAASCVSVTRIAMAPGNRAPPAAPPLRVSSPTASPHAEQRLLVAGLASPDRLRLQVFSTS